MSLRRGTGVAAVGAATGSVLGIIGLKAYEVVKVCRLEHGRGVASELILHF